MKNGQKFYVTKNIFSEKVFENLKKSNFLSKKLNFWSKNEIFSQNNNFGQKSKLWDNIEISVRK